MASTATTPPSSTTKMPPSAKRAEDELAEHDGGLGRVDALAEHGLGERVGGRDDETGDAQAGVDGDRGERRCGAGRL